MNMTGATIRAGTGDDFEAISKIYTGPGDGPLDHFADVERMRKIPVEGWLVAEVDGSIVGFLYWFRHRNPWWEPEVDEYVDIQELHVEEAYRRRGIGRALVDHAVEEARERGIRTVFIDTSDDNTAARRLYEGAGFREQFRDVHYKLVL